MKNILQILVSTFLLIVNPFFQNSLFAHQHPHYFTVVIDNPHKDNNQPEVFYYPAGTTFELLSKKGKVFATSKDKREQHTYWGDFSLKIYPTYKSNQPDEIKIQRERVRIFDNEEKAQAAGFIYKKTTHKTTESEESKENNYVSNGVTISEKLVTASTVKENELNLELTFSNGVTFKYVDGNATATQNDKNLKITNKYLIYSEFGVVKLSYNPKTAKIWWIYEPTEL